MVAIDLEGWRSCAAPLYESLARYQSCQVRRGSLGEMKG